MDDDANDLFSIAISDAENESQGAKGAEKDESRVAQSEEAYEKVRREYRPKIENGEIWKEVSFPLGENGSKYDKRQTLAAVEELYFFRRFEEALDFVKRAVAGYDEGDAEDSSCLQTLRQYQAKLEVLVSRSGEH